MNSSSLSVKAMVEGRCEIRVCEPDRTPVCAELVGQDRRQRRANALTDFRLGDDDCDLVVRSDPHPCRDLESARRCHTRRQL